MGGLTGASCPSSPGHDDTGFLRQNDAGVNMALTHDEMRRGMAPWWLTVVAQLLRARMTVSGGSSALSASRSSSTPSSWPPLASPGDGLARPAVGQWHTAAARV
jgi:hypothetical protein